MWKGEAESKRAKWQRRAEDTERDREKPTHPDSRLMIVRSPGRLPPPPPPQPLPWQRGSSETLAFSNMCRATYSKTLHDAQSNNGSPRSEERIIIPFRRQPTTELTPCTREQRLRAFPPSFVRVESSENENASNTPNYASWPSRQFSPGETTQFLRSLLR